MKKIKLMLLSLTVLATVGAALAFNVKGTERFCTAAPNTNGTCPNACPNDRTGNFITGQPFICTTPTSGLSNPCQNSSGTTLTCGATSVQVRLD